MTEMDLAYFLHENGYNFFQIPLLTYPEINLLVEKHNKIKREEARQQRLANKRR